MDVVKVAVKSKNSDMKIYIDAFVSENCHPLEGQNINLAQYQSDHLKNLDLADYSPKGLPMNIDLLIGSQDYLNFIRYKQVRRKSGSIAISSRLGLNV